MTSPSRALGLAALAILAVTALASCAGTASGSPRTKPNRAETIAVIQASGFEGSGGRLEMGAPWVQLWTKRQLPEQIQRCEAVGFLVEQCTASHPLDLRVFAMSSRDRSTLYGYYLTFLDRCLDAHGHAVDSIPSRAAFLRSVGDAEPWSPYDTVFVGSRTEWYALSDACPPVPTALAGVEPGQ